ncbi:MAG: FecR domain-containing protein [Ignavibacteriales bacterium]|nr:FecR domain-containing protein [Ignavibacteriales bacterium]
MNCFEITPLLLDYFDNLISEEQKKEIENHVKDCIKCSKDFKIFTDFFSQIESLPQSVQPPKGILDQIFNEINNESELKDNNSNAVLSKNKLRKIKKQQRLLEEKEKADHSKIKKLPLDLLEKPINEINFKSRFSKKKILVILPLLIAILVICLYLYTSLQENYPWEIIKSEGSYVIQNRLTDQKKFYLDDKLITHDYSNVTVKIADFGLLHIDQNSIIKLIDAQKGENRIKLFQGSVSANTWTQTGKFSIETQNAITTENKSNFKINYFADTTTVINVISGFVEINSGNNVFMLPEGYTFKIHQNETGIPVNNSSTGNLKIALIEFEKKHDQNSFNIILNESAEFDALTLWHIFPLIDEHLRGKLFDKLNSFYAAPNGVTKQGILELNKEMLKKWWDEIAWQI